MGTKIRIFNTNVKSVLLYGAETWTLTKQIVSKLQSFINGCLRKIMGIHWPDTIRNVVLWKRTKQQPIDREILRRRWRWIGHTLRKPAQRVTRQALRWNPQGKRKRGRPRSTWERELEGDLRQMGYSWREVERIAQDRGQWRTLLDGLYPHPG